MASADLVPRAGQAAGGWQAVLVAVLAQGGLRFEAKGYNDVAIQRLPDVGHEPTAVGVKPPQGQFLGELGQFRRASFIDLQPYQAGGLGHDVGSGIDGPGAPRFRPRVEAKADKRRPEGRRDDAAYS